MESLLKRIRDIIFNPYNSFVEGTGMLKKIIFLINDRSLNNADVNKAVYETKRYVEECGYASELIAFDAKSVSFAANEGAGNRDSSQILFATDSGRVCEMLSREGCYVLGIRHALNQEEEFLSAKYIFSEIEEVDIDSFVKVYQRYSGEPWEILRTDRLIVRESTIEDVDEFYRIYKDPEMTRYMEGLFDDPEDEKRYQRDYIKKVYGLMGFGIWTLVRKSDGKIIGRAGFSVRNGFDEVELGFLIGKDYQRQGYALEACGAILDYGKNVLRFDKVQTLVKAENTVSIHLCEKLGFVRVEEVDVDENIYGSCYKEGQKASPSKDRRGKYVRMIKID